MEERRPSTPKQTGPEWRHAGLLGLAGWCMASVATLLHPRVPALAAWEAGLKGAAAPLWVPVHLGLALGMALLIPGVATLHSLLVRRGVARLSGVAVTLFRLALPLWWTTVSWELTVVPTLGRTLLNAPPPAAELLRDLVQGAWAFPLLLGYFATFSMWAAVALWGLDLHKSPVFTGWAASWAVMGGVLGCLGLPVGALIPAPWAVWAMGLTGGIPGAWLALAAYRLWREAGDIRSAAVRS